MVIGGTHRNDLKNHALNRMESLYTIDYSLQLCVSQNILKVC